MYNLREKKGSKKYGGIKFCAQGDNKFKEKLESKCKGNDTLKARPHPLILRSAKGTSFMDFFDHQ